MEGINYEIKYAYAEVYEIINWLGEEYKNKIPKKIFQQIKAERRIDYKPNFDFTKPLHEQPMRQETRNLIAYLNHYYWCTDEKQKEAILEQIRKNAENKKIKAQEARRREIAMKAKMQGTVLGSIDQALRKNNR